MKQDRIFKGGEFDLEDAHPEFDVTFKDGDKFTLELKGKYYEVVNAHDPDLILSVDSTDPQLQHLMENSESLEFMFFPDSRNPSYPFLQDFKFKDVRKLYDYFNKKYFNGGCPSNIKFSSKLESGYSGLALSKGVLGSPEKMSFVIHINTRDIRNDHKAFVDALLHEMIHVFLTYSGVKEGNTEKVYDNHGPYFLKEMNRLNSEGFDIVKALKTERVDESREDAYLLVIIYKPLVGGTEFLCGWTSDARILNVSDAKLIDANKVHLQHVAYLCTYSTKATHVSAMPALKSNFGIPSNQKDKRKPIRHLLPADLIKRITVPKDIVILNDSVVAPFLRKPFSSFFSVVKRQGITQPEALGIWKHVPTKVTLDGISEAMEDLKRAYVYKGNSTMLEEYAETVYKVGEDRLSHAAYKRAVEAAAKRLKAPELLTKYASQLKL